MTNAALFLTLFIGNFLLVYENTTNKFFLVTMVIAMGGSLVVIKLEVIVNNIVEKDESGSQAKQSKKYIECKFKIINEVLIQSYVGNTQGNS